MGVKVSKGQAPPHSSTVIHSLDVNTSHLRSRISPDLLPSFPPLMAFSFHLCLLCHSLMLSICKHMHTYCISPQLHTAKLHRIESRLLSETHVLGGTILYPHINTQNQNIMFYIMSAGKLMNNRERMKRVLILFPQSRQQPGNKNQPQVTSISALKE